MTLGVFKVLDFKIVFNRGELKLSASQFGLVLMNFNDHGSLFETKQIFKKFLKRKNQKTFRALSQ